MLWPIVMAYIVMACIVMAHSYGVYSYGDIEVSTIYGEAPMAVLHGHTRAIGVIVQIHARNELLASGRVITI